MAIMTTDTAEMWGVYDYKGHRVTVIQQWEDPFGQRMVRVQVVESEANLATGMPEVEFMREAVLVSAAEQAGRS